MVTKLLRFCWLSFLLTGCTPISSFFSSAPPDLGNAPPVSAPAVATAAAPGIDLPLAAPHQVALLLSDQGGLVVPAQAITAGFNDAWQTATSKPVIKTYDLAKAASVSAAYQQAIADGADRVVGPLLKTNVSSLASNFHGQVLTIALNHVDKQPTTLSPWWYEFGLSPTDEARQVADKAFADGHRSALLITPAGAWGDNLANTITQQFQKDGGQIVGSIALTGQSNVNAAITQLLSVRGTTRRQDFDVIFMLVQPLLARQIKPLLNYYGAQNIPVYSTSLVFTGLVDSTADRTLDGVEFCDMPLVLDQQGPWAQLRQQFTLAQPGTLQPYIRLYGLGWDAALLTQQINQLNNGGGFQGATGYLYIDSQHHILRKLRWAIFQQGVPVPIN